MSEESLPSAAEKPKSETESSVPSPVEQDGPKRLDPTRYQDWEKGGRCIDF
ncbi:MAG TPA: DUF1674 domain-containing protein [Telmatospirillum sp.]|nr:DUF1674 domain-containing protein [Telmatospirillum sp.]